MKKLLIALGALILVVLVVLVSVPFFVDVDHYRPMIVEKANENLNGRLELGKLKLSLWGAVKVNAESIKLTVNGFQKPLVDTNQFALEIPFSSLLSGRPLVIAVLKAPKIDIEKNAAGEMNMMKLMKSAAAAKGAAVDSGAARGTASAGSQEPPKVPAFIAGAMLGLSIQDGEVVYTDAVSKAKYSVTGLSLDARNLGFASTMELHFTAPLKGGSPEFSFDGPVLGDAEITPLLVDGMVRSAKGKIAIDAGKLAVEMPGGRFKKSAGVPLELKAIFDGNEKDLLVRSAELRVHEFKLNTKGLVQTAPLTAKLELATDTIRLEKLQDIVPLLAAYGLKGAMNMNANMETDGAKHRLSGDLKLVDGEFFLKEFLKAPLKLTLQAAFTESSTNIARAQLSGPDTELQLQGTISNFLAPQIALTLNGKSFNVDKTLVLEAEEGKSAALGGMPGVADASAAEKKAPAKPVMVNPMAVLASNPILMNANGYLTAQLGRLTVAGAKLEAISAKAQLQRLNLKLQQASLKTFGGTVNSTGDFDLKSPGLNYKSQGKASEISAKEAFSSYFPKYKNTIEGTVNADWNVAGALYPEAMRLKSLSGTAKLTATDGVFRTVDVQESINAAMGKVPFLKGKTIKVDEGFKLFSADMKISGGNIDVNPIHMVPKGKGFEIKGKSRITADLDQETFLDIYDPQGQLPKEISKPGQVAIALRVYGPLTSPKTDYEYTVKRLASTAAKGAAQSALKDVGKKIFGEGDQKNPLKQLKDKFKLKF